MKLYVACLASYNNGVLHGKWIDASSYVEDMQEQINQVLMSSKFPNVTVSCPDCEGDPGVYRTVLGKTCSKCDGKGEVPSAEEWAVHDYEFGSNIASLLGEYPSLQVIADLVELIEEYDSWGYALEIVDGLAAHQGGVKVDDLRDALEDSFVGVFGSFAAYADEQADEFLQAHEVPDPVATYFDYDAWRQTLEMEMTQIDVPGGVAVFHS